MKGKLNLVSVGPGFAEHITSAARQALEESDAIVGYDLYLNWIKPWIETKEIHRAPLTQERERALKAIELARLGRTVSLVSSGDIGIYAMAALTFEQLGDAETFELKVIPGITAASACASLLGSPISHDFATLSLSDLLCPWSWIEERAKHLAEADMCIVLYNVQSEKRQDGVYKILQILLEHKPEETLCGVVRNAYRPEQSVQIDKLGNLPERKFDMFTTILVGNRYTAQKGDFLFTPRGYNGWAERVKDAPGENGNGSNGDKIDGNPPEAVWVFSGTSDGNRLAKELAAVGGRGVVLSVASDYGAELASIACPGLTVVKGGNGAEQRSHLLKRSMAHCIVDATHPYAEQISRQLVELSSRLDIPYIRYERPVSKIPPDAIVCDAPEAAAAVARRTGKRIFLATGSKDVQRFTSSSSQDVCQWFIRIVPDRGNLEAVLDAGIPRDRICAMQGSFSEAFNETLWRDWEIDCVITKESGEAGGFDQKIAAARKLGIPVIVVKRPAVDYPKSAGTFQEILEFVQEVRSRHR
jgi:cobalt-factor III methyltransferase